MRVGMNRARGGRADRRDRVPHACGDEPINPRVNQGKGLCSPCVWG